MPLNTILNSPQTRTALTGALSGAAGGAITTALLNKKSARGILKAGGLVAVGGLAMKAWQSYSATQNQSQPPNHSQQQNLVPHATHIQAPVSTPLTAMSDDAAQSAGPIALEANSEALLILSSMIAAAHADGILTDAEQQQVWTKSVESGLPSEDLGAIAEALQNPMTPQQIAELATTMPARIEVYTAAACVIDGDCDAGTQYLQSLEQQLELPASLASALRSKAAQASR